MSNHTGITFQQIWKRMDHERRRQVTAAFFSSTENARRAAEGGGIDREQAELATAESR